MNCQKMDLIESLYKLFSRSEKVKFGYFCYFLPISPKLCENFYFLFRFLGMILNSCEKIYLIESLKKSF